MPYTNTYANQILNYTMGKVATLTAPAYVYIGLCSNDPEADSGTITELSGNGYSRVLISQKGESYPDVIGSANNRAIKNTKQINWTKATGNWAEAKGFFLSSSGTVGETSSIFFYGKLANAVTCSEGAVMLFDPNALQIGFAYTDAAVATASE